MSQSSDSARHVHPALGLVRLPHGRDLDLPAYETPGSAGMDLRAAVPEDRPLLLLPPGS